MATAVEAVVESGGDCELYTEPTVSPVLAESYVVVRDGAPCRLLRAVVLVAATAGRAEEVDSNIAASRRFTFETNCKSLVWEPL